MAITAVALGPEYRASALRRLGEEQFDILVIGAGVVGAGAALDAASRGLKVGAGRGARLRLGDVEPVVEAGARRPALPQAAQLPSRVRGAARAQAHPREAVPAPGPPGRVHLPAGEAVRGPRLGRARASASTTSSAPAAGCPATCGTCRRRRPLRSFRSGKPDAIKGGIAFYEGQLDDARHTMVIARTAAEYGAAVASSTRVDLVPARRATRSSAPSPATWSRARRSASGPRPRSTPPGSGPTRSRR